MDENSTLIVKRYFREYYFRFGERMKTPSEIASREFGYFPFGGVMIRHLSFKDIGALRATLVREAPAGVYCSNSLYADPTAEMHLKGWRSAELIFDIDADTLRSECKKVHDVWLCKSCGKKEFGLRPETCPDCKQNRILEMTWTCSNCLDGTKKETMKLLEFLEFDLDIPPSGVKVYFSGNAGYHVDVGKSAYDGLDSHARAEISDYLTGRGMMPSFFNSNRMSPGDPGWRGRIARFIRDLPDGDNLFKSSAFEKRQSELVNDFSKKQFDCFMERAISETSVRIDAMVTTDVHRIFRMPESVNNKTGLVKRECRGDLSSFDPSSDPIAIRDDSMIEITVDMAPKIELAGQSYGPYKTEQVKVPLYVAIYIVSKGAGNFVIPGKKSIMLQKSSQRVESVS